MKTVLLLALLALFAGCATTDQRQAARDYTLGKVIEAAAAELKKVKNTTEFYLSNIPPGSSAEPQVILKFIRDCRTAGQAGAIASDRLDQIYEVISAAFAQSSDERFDGLVLIIVSAKKDSARFDSLLVPRGITPVYATY